MRDQQRTILDLRFSICGNYRAALDNLELFGRGTSPYILRLTDEGDFSRLSAVKQIWIGQKALLPMASSPLSDLQR